MFDLGQHSGIRTGNSGEAKDGNSGTGEENIKVLDRDRNLAQLPVISAGDKKDVGTFTQYFLSLITRTGTPPGVARGYESPEFHSGSRLRSHFGDEAVALPVSYQNQVRPENHFWLQSKLDAALSSVKMFGNSLPKVTNWVPHVNDLRCLKWVTKGG